MFYLANNNFYMYSISSFIVQHFNLSDDAVVELPFKTSIKNFEKHAVITNYHQVEKYGYLLTKGLVKISMIKEGEERILDFFFPGDFFSSYTSFLSQTPSDVEIVCLTDVEVECIYYQDLQDAYKTSLLANQFGRMVTEASYIRKTNREKDFLTRSATERYLDLVEKRPELIHDIPVHMLAKYLGIQPESLSRIRKEIS
jgi:CRP-like cAMP-binding protein